MAPVQCWPTRFLSRGVVWERKESERKGEEKVETGFPPGDIGSVCAFLPVVPPVPVCLGIDRLAPDRFLAQLTVRLILTLLSLYSVPP